MPILLDTCAVIWISGGQKISETAMVSLVQKTKNRVSTFISPITAWELGTLVSKGRIPTSVSEHVWLGRVLALPYVEYSHLTPDILINSSYLPGHPPNDPTDRIIIATARQYGYRIMTRDKKILDYANEGHVNAIAC